MLFGNRHLTAAALAVVMLTARAETPATVMPITLDEAIATARAQSVDAAVALNELMTAYW